jgi:nucleoside-diphosphate-sugar epimerase
MQFMSGHETSLDTAGGRGAAPGPILVVGCGYLGWRVALRAESTGRRVWATTRRRTKARRIAEAGLEPLLIDWTDRRTLSRLPEVDRVLVAVSYDRQSGAGRDEAIVGGFRNLLASLSPDVDVCYISTTGVYHQTDGRWVDETSPARPAREGGRAHLRAEQLLHRLRPQSPWTVLRLAGLYGPGRVPRAADVIAGRPIASPEHGFLNLIHVDDAASAVLRCWQKPAPQRKRLYVVADDEPVIRGEFYREIARQCDAPPPRFVEPDAESAVAARSQSNKRVWNRRMKQELLPRLAFPSYREGLAAVLGGGVPDRSATF